jgi:hypothetical protein
MLNTEGYLKTFFFTNKKIPKAELSGFFNNSINFIISYSSVQALFLLLLHFVEPASLPEFFDGMRLAF